jgi:predicted N-acyltransferase
MQEEFSPSDYVIRVVEDPSEIDDRAWDALVDAQPGGTPFLRHAYLAALHRSGSATAHTGWLPQYVTLWRNGELQGACPAYLKSHSYGEYVFDWAWAEAHERHGLPYYPKLTVAVPFTPVPGPRLLARDTDTRRILLRALRLKAEQLGLSSVHVLFLSEDDVVAARSEGWLLRGGVQFHWHNRQPQPYGSFDEFLADLHRDKRKKILQERRRVADAGVTFEVRAGGEITETDWDFFYRCYLATYRAHRSTPYLTRPFFADMAATLPEHWLMFIARRDGRPIAASLLALDPFQSLAYGRYWGSLEPLACLHFEACYYQPLAWCMAQGYRRFEGGAQGEHKMARGLRPVTTQSAHWLSQPAFADAVARFLDREALGLAAYMDELRERDPFRAIHHEGTRLTP